MGETLTTAVAAFEQSPSQARKTLRDLMSADLNGFCVAALPLLKRGRGEAGVQFLYEMLTGKGLLPFCNPALLSLEEEVAIARGVMEKEPMLDVKLARRLSESAAAWNSETGSSVRLRILEVLEAISDGGRILPMLIQALRDPDPRLRSKAALVVGRTNKSAQWVEQVLRERDARVRANSIEALWGVDTEAVRAVLWAAAKDPNNRVLGNALLGLYRLGDAAAIGPILKMSEHAAPLFRATAAWVMGETGDPRFLASLARMVREADTKARHNVFKAIARLKQATARWAEAAALRVSIYQASPQADGSRLVHAAVSLEDGAEVCGLLPTGVVLWEGQRMVAEYSLGRPRATDWLALGLALPAAQTCPQLSSEMVEKSVQACLALKRGADRWGIARFDGPREDAKAGESAAKPPPCFLTPDAEALSSRLNDPENRFAYIDVVQGLLKTVALAAGNRNLLLLEDRTAGSTLPELPPARWGLIIRDAQTASVAIHAVVLTDPDRPAGILTDISSQTRGVCLSTSDPEQVPELCGKLYFGLLHPYEIRYRPEPGEPAGPLKLQVYAAQGYGEDILGGP